MSESRVFIFLDESGDFGWKFNLPYGQGGSSRYLTLGAVLCPAHKQKLLTQTMKKFHEKVKKRSPKEVKWEHLNKEQRIDAARMLKQIKSQHPDIAFLTITLLKESVCLDKQKQPSELHMSMIGTLLLGKIQSFDYADLHCDKNHLDPKVMQRRFQLTLWMHQGADTILSTQALESHLHSPIQAADLLAGIAQSKYEHDEKAPWNVLAPYIECIFLSNV